MLKRIACFILSLVLLLALVPAGAVTANAASMTTSDKAVTILKALYPYRSTCDSNGYFGYGLKCTESGDHGVTTIHDVDGDKKVDCTSDGKLIKDKTQDCQESGKHGLHTIREEEADEMVRDMLKTADKALNSFASGNGISLTQNQHDALAIFTYRYGQAWMNGSDDIRAAVIRGTKGSAFLNAMINWGTAAEAEKRMVMANMYLNNKYVSSKPSNFVKITYQANGGKLPNGQASLTYYYDSNSGELLETPTNGKHTFVGWYTNSNDPLTLVTLIPSKDTTLTAKWQDSSVTAENPVYYNDWLKASKLNNTVTYMEVNGKAEGNIVGGEVHHDYYYVDKNGVQWLHILTATKFNGSDWSNNFAKPRWVQWRKVTPGSVNVGSSDDSSSGSTSSVSGIKITVTNSYINVRKAADITSLQIGTVYQGEQYYVTETKQNGIWLWGRIVNEKGTLIGYIALMYTDYDSILASQKAESSVGNASNILCKATVDVNGYVHVRNGAGTAYDIVSTYRNGTEVNIYSIVYVNGTPWGQTEVGWFNLKYAIYDTSVAGQTSSFGYVNYMFKDIDFGTAGKTVKDAVAGADKAEPVKGKVNLANLKSDSLGNTWAEVFKEGKSKGWIMITEGNDTARIPLEELYTTLVEVAMRAEPNAGTARTETLAKGTEVKVFRFVVTEDTIWGYAKDTATGKYEGWVNLSTANFSKNGAALTDAGGVDTTKKATVAKVNTNLQMEMNVRASANIFSDVVTTLPNGTVVEVLEGPAINRGVSSWYKLKIDGFDVDCWARGDNLEVYEGTLGDVSSGAGTATSPDGTKAATGRGMVVETYGGVNFRTGPSTAYGVITKILPGTEVTILEVTNTNGDYWGRTTVDGTSGWVNMGYISMMEYDELPGSTGTSSTVTSSTKAVYTAVAGEDLEVRKEPKYNVAADGTYLVRNVTAGDPITVYELLATDEVIKQENDETTTKTYYWARVNDGYIWLDTSKDVNTVIDLDALNEQVYTVTSNSALKVREGAGTEYSREELDLKPGEQVKITNVKIAKNEFWGQIEHKDLTGGEGWICLTYCAKGAVTVNTGSDNSGSGSGSGTEGGSTEATTPPASGEYMSMGNTGTSITYAGKVIGGNNVTKVAVRKDTDLDSDEVVSLDKGTAITITKTTVVDGRAWGYCGTGWIYLYYVDLTPVGTTAIDAKVVANNNASVYDSSSGGNKIGSYAKQAVVLVYETVNGMYRTDMGWIATTNCL